MRKIGKSEHWNACTADALGKSSGRAADAILHHEERSQSLGTAAKNCSVIEDCCVPATEKKHRCMDTKCVVV